jgi:hypothetical protein
LKANFEFVHAECFVLGEEDVELFTPERLRGTSHEEEFQQVGEVEGTGIRFDVDTRHIYGCIFYNSPTAAPQPSPSPSPSPSPVGGGADATPTAPDTAALPGDDRQIGGGGNILVLIVVATIALAVVLVSTQGDRRQPIRRRRG